MKTATQGEVLDTVEVEHLLQEEQNEENADDEYVTMIWKKSEKR